MKTIEEHLREALTPEQFAKAEKYRDVDWGYGFAKPSDSLLFAFDFSYTNESFKYWDDIYKELKNKEQ